uniref:Uncharacterized protein n=1 Tax=Anguilla anguilla TaxID=7936 RepID=A0A0E9UNT7_ANGAN
MIAELMIFLCSFSSCPLAFSTCSNCFSFLVSTSSCCSTSAFLVLSVFMF